MRNRFQKFSILTYRLLSLWLLLGSVLAITALLPDNSWAHTNAQTELIQSASEEIYIDADSNESYIYAGQQNSPVNASHPVCPDPNPTDFEKDIEGEEEDFTGNNSNLIAARLFLLDIFEKNSLFKHLIHSESNRKTCPLYILFHCRKSHLV